MASNGRVLLAVTAGYFLIMFAVSPVPVILPSLSEALGADVAHASWVMTAYLLPLTALLLPAGRLGDMLGHRRVFTAGLLLAAVAALGAGLSQHLADLLAARVVQGIGAALVSAASLPIITSAVDPARRGRSIGLATMSSSVGAMAGTGLAPLFLQYLDWRWVFYAGGVAGVAAVGLAVRMGTGGEVRPAGRVRLDWAGAVLLLATLVVASLSLNHLHDGPETFSAGWRWHVPMHAATLSLLVMFVIVERRVPSPLIRLDKLRNGLFTTAIGANGILHMTMMMATFSLPFLLQLGMGRSTAETGALLFTMQLCTTSMTIAAGWLYDRTRSPWMCPLALSMVASGLTVLGLFSRTLSFGQCLATILWMGTGSGIFMTSNNTRIMGALEPTLRGFASGMLETTRQYGHTLGVAVAAIGLASVLGVAGGDGAVLAAQQLALRQGFGLSALVMAGIAWAGMVLAAYPLYAGRLGGLAAQGARGARAVVAGPGVPALAPAAADGL